MGITYHVGVAKAVHSDAGAEVTKTAPEVGGVDEGRTGGIQFCHERIAPADESRLEGPRRGREVRGEGAARHIGVAGRVHGDALSAPITLPDARIVVTAPEVGGVDEGGTGGIQFCHEGIDKGSRIDRAKGPRRNWEVQGGRVAGHVGVPRGVDGNAVAKVPARSTEVGGVDERWVNHQGARGVIRGHLKPDLLRVGEHVSPWDHVPRPLHRLIHNGCG